MIYKKIQLYDDKDYIHLTTLVSEFSKELPNKKKTAVLVLPGGGYYMTSDREAEPVAKAFFAAGMNAFVLRYSVNTDAVGFKPLLDAVTAIKIIRENAEEWNINADRIIVCGFSAGGHLAASTGTLWKLDELSEKLGCDKNILKPNGMILCYPVITAGDKAHKGSIYKLVGKENPTQEEMDVFSLEKRVDADTCPAFIWHTAQDSGVPVENALLMSEALSKNKIPFELHVFPYGVHGLSIATDETAPIPEMEMPYVARWVDMAIKWIKEALFTD